VIELPEEKVKSHSRKDTKRWCKGKVGREHEYQRRPKEFQWNPHCRPIRKTDQVWVMCVNCGRQKDYLGLFDKSEAFIWMNLNLHNDLRQMRIGAGLTQEQLAERSGIKQPVISRLESENNYRLPCLSTVERLANACGCEVSILFPKKEESICANA
jgi:DNA-binding XRE family transcriptional regulator